MVCPIKMSNVFWGYVRDNTIIVNVVYVLIFWDTTRQKERFPTHTTRNNIHKHKDRLMFPGVDDSVTMSCCFFFSYQGCVFCFRFLMDFFSKTHLKPSKISSRPRPPLTHLVFTFGEKAPSAESASPVSTSLNCLWKLGKFVINKVVERDLMLTVLG